MINKKNVLIMIPILNVAGAEKFVVDLAINLDKNKYNVFVGTLYKAKDNYFEEILINNSINVINFFGNNKLQIFKNIKNYFKNNKIDILHTNLNTILYTMFFAKKYKINKCIFTFHSTADRVDSNLKKKMYRYAFLKLGFVPVAISEYIKQTVVEEFKINKELIECVYNGVDIEKYQLKEKECNTQVKLINVGTLYYIKNQKFLIESFKLLTDKGYNLKLVILGDGPLKDELGKLISSLALDDLVELKGMVNNVDEYLQNSDIYCCTSLVEGLPLSVLEAMACGLPVISTKAGGVIDIVKDDENGYICDNFSLIDYANLIEKLIINNELRIKMGNESRRKVEELSIQNCAENYEKIYDK